MLDRQRLERAYVALCASRSEIVRANSEEQLLNAMCRMLVDLGGYRLVWVGYAVADASRSVMVRAAASADVDDSEDVRRSVGDACGTWLAKAAIRTGEPQVRRDAQLDAPPANPTSQALGTSLALPLKVDGATFGALGLSAACADAFDAGEHALLLRIAEDLAFAVGALRARFALERKELLLQEAAKMELVGRLTSGIVHDFNNLLAIVHGCGTELTDLLPSGSPAHAIARNIVEAGRRATELSRRVLTVGRTRPARARPLSPSHVLSGVRPLIDRLLGEGIECEFSIADDLGLIEIDVASLEQVLLNLAVNARDAMPAGGRLSIALWNTTVIPDTVLPAGRRIGRAVVLEVTDTGVGIERDVIAQLFQPFFTTKPDGQGTGLGLTVVWGIMERAGGCIAVESAPGAGTTFRLYFPMVETHTSHAATCEVALPPC